MTDAEKHIFAQVAGSIESLRVSVDGIRVDVGRIQTHLTNIADHEARLRKLEVHKGITENYINEHRDGSDVEMAGWAKKTFLIALIAIIISSVITVACTVYSASQSVHNQASSKIQPTTKTP